MYTAARVWVTPEPVQPPQTLRERAHAACLRDEVLRVQVRADLEGLRRDHDEIPFAGGVSGVRSAATAGGGIKDAFARICSASRSRLSPVNNRRLGVRRLSAQVVKCLARRPGRVGEDQAGRRLRSTREQVRCRFREQLRGVAPVGCPHLHGLRRVQPLNDGRVLPVLLIEVEPLDGGVARRGQRGDARPRAGRPEQGLRAGRAFGERAHQRSQVWGEMRLVEEDEAVGSGHRGVDRAKRPRRSIPPEQ